MIVSKFEGTEFHKMSSAKNDDNEGKVMESVDQANAISKVDEHIKARFNMLFIKFNDLPKLAVGNQKSVDKWNEEFKYFHVAYPDVLEFLLDYNPKDKFKVKKVEGIYFTGWCLQMCLQSIFDRFRLIMISKLPKHLQKEANLIKAAYDAVTKSKDYTITSKILLKFVNVEHELVVCYNLPYLLQVEEKLEEILYNTSNVVDEYVRSLPNLIGQVLYFNHVKKSEALSLFLNIHASYYSKWIQADNDTSVLPSCSTIAEEMCDHPDYARLVDIPSNKYELNLIVSLPAPEKPKGKPEENSLEQSQKKNLKSRKRNKKHPKSDNDKGEKEKEKEKTSLE